MGPTHINGLGYYYLLFVIIVELDTKQCLFPRERAANRYQPVQLIKVVCVQK